MDRSAEALPLIEIGRRGRLHYQNKYFKDDHPSTCARRRWIRRWRRSIQRLCLQAYTVVARAAGDAWA